MRFLIWFLLAFSWIEKSEEITSKTYQFTEFSDLTPYTEIPCPLDCTQRMRQGTSLVSNILGSTFEASTIPVEFCKECLFGGIHNVTSDTVCFMSPEGDVFDYHIVFLCPYFYVNCTCDLSNDPSTAAQKVNEAKLVAGECGMERAQNTLKCPTVECSGTGQGESKVKIMTNVGESLIHTVIRVDTRKENPGAFAIRYSLTTDSDDPIIVSGPPEFDDAANCLKENHHGIMCQIIGNYPVHIFDCLKGDGDLSGSVLYEYGKCLLARDEL